jgi:Fe-S-cluster containining protein
MRIELMMTNVLILSPNFARMNEMKALNLPAFRRKAKMKKGILRRFLSKIEREKPRGLMNIVNRAELEVWRETDCLSCANCCKTMTPTFNNADIRRISAHLGYSVADFKARYLRKERGKDGDWLNKVEPCQFLNPADNKCSIYEVRPADCAGFPHLPKKMLEYMHVHKQNVEYCPATFRLVEKMMQKIG